MTEEQKDEPKVGLGAVFASVLASFGGVQNRERHERDFKHGRARDFIIVGIVITLLFIAVVFGVVKLVMGLAGV